MSGVNQHAKDVPCLTCNGDRFVVVSTRPVKQSSWMADKGITPPKNAAIEEHAPCPSCNPALDTEFYRFDGSKARSPDPAQVRQMMRS